MRDKNAFWHLQYIVGARAITLVGQLAYIKIYSNTLAHRDLGFYFLLLSIVAGYTALIYYPVDQYQQAHLYAYKRSGISLRSFLPLNLRLLGAATALVFLAMAAWYTIDGRLHFELFVCFILAQLMHVVSSIRNFLNNLEHKAIAAAYFAAEALAKSAVLLAASWLILLTPMGVIGAAVVSMALVGILILSVTMKSGQFAGGRLESPPLLDVLHFSAPISAAAVFSWLQLQGFRFLAPFGFAETVGIYATVAGVGGSAVIAVSPILIQMYQPEIFKTHGKFTPKYLRYAGILVAAVAIGVAALAVPTVRVLTNKSFVSYAFIALFGVGVEGANVLLGGMAPYFNLRKRTGVFFVAGAIALLVSCALLLLVLLTHTITPYTIGLCLVLSQLSSVLYTYAAYRRLVRTEVLVELNDC